MMFCWLHSREKSSTWTIAVGNSINGTIALVKIYQNIFQLFLPFPVKQTDYSYYQSDGKKRNKKIPNWNKIIFSFVLYTEDIR